MEELVGKLEGILGEGEVLTDEISLASYSYDASGYIYRPEVVIRPGNIDELTEVVKVLMDYRVPITPRGAGTSLVGGPLPVNGGAVIDLQMLNEVLEVDEDQGIVQVEAGVKVAELNELIDGRFMPINPDGTGSSTIGGLAAEDAASPLSSVYGTVKDLILGMEVLLPNGDLVSLDGPVNRSRRNLIDLLIGSEGTLGIVTSVTLKLPTEPEERMAYEITFNDLMDAMSLAEEMEKAGIRQAAFEVYHNLGLVMGSAETEAVGYLEIMGPPECVNAWDSRIRELSNRVGVTSINPIDPYEADTIWKERAKIYEVAKATKSALKVGSFKVSPSSTRDFVQEVDRTSNRMKLKSISVINPLLGWVIAILLHKRSESKEVERAEKGMSEIVRISNNMESSMGYGLGVGINRISADIDEGFVQIYSAIKRSFDPYWLFNPGKLIERD